MKRLIVLVFLFCTIPAFATTWYVNATGGTRYSVNMTSGQCNGQSAAAYPGTGVNQNCAFGDVRYLWADGSGASDGSTFPKWGWIGAGGDTYLIDCPNDCRIGANNPNTGDWSLGLGGDPYGSGAPVPISGTSGAHTKIMGLNYANCTSDSSKAHLNGGYGVQNVFNLTSASYVDLACFNITDHSNCGKGSQTNSCVTSWYSGSTMSDYADNGISFNNTTANITLTDIRVHGLTANGMIGALGNGSSMLRVVLAGNALSGMEFDDGSGTSGTGTLTMSYFQVLWSGCAEEYPIVDAVPYQDCTDDNTGGYGDGVGTGDGDVGWLINIDHSVAAYNTQDGFDLLHLRGAGSRLTITDSLGYGNMGQQLKTGRAATATNNLLVGNCNALRQAIPGTPTGYNSRLSDFCRAADNAVVISVQDSQPTIFQFNTVYSANSVAVDVECGLSPCTNLSTVAYQNNIVFGFLNNTANGYPSGGNGGYANPVYLDGVPTTIFSNSGSTYSFNATYHGSNPCPNTSDGETNGICVDPQLTDETWHLYSYGNMAPKLGSPVIGAGTTISGIPTDYNGVTRPNPPSMGALEYGSLPSGAQIVINAAPNQATLEQPVTLTATVAQTGSAVPTGSIIFFLNGSVSLGQASLDSEGTATLVLSSLYIGSYAVVASYSGDSNYPAGESDAVPLQVLSATTTSLVASPNPVLAGQALPLTATVEGSEATAPSGTVSFLNGSATLGTATLNSAGVATLSTTLPAAGTYSLTAQYAGNTSFLASTSVSVTVNAQAAAIDQSFSVNAGGSTPSQTILPGETAAYTLAVSPAAGATLPAISFAVSGLPAGTTATFSPQTIAAGSGATNVTLSIQAPAQSAMLERNGKLGGGLSVVALGFLLLPFGGGLRRSGKRMMRFSCMVLLLAGAASLAGLTGCTAGVYSPNAKSYTVTVISTAASMSQTTSVTLTVE